MRLMPNSMSGTYVTHDTRSDRPRERPAIIRISGLDYKPSKMDSKSQAQQYIEEFARERASEKKTRNIRDLERSVQKYGLMRSLLP